MIRKRDRHFFKDDIVMENEKIDPQNTSNSLCVKSLEKFIYHTKTRLKYTLKSQ